MKITDKPFFKKNRFDGLIKSVHFYQNIVFIFKGEKKIFSSLKTSVLVV